MDLQAGSAIIEIEIDIVIGKLPEIDFDHDFDTDLECPYFENKNALARYPDCLTDIAKKRYLNSMTDWHVRFLNDTVESEFDSLPLEVKAKTVHIANLIKEFALPNIGMPYVRHVQDKIWEIRAVGKAEKGRCLYVAGVGKQVVILRCFVKKCRKLPQKELAIALSRAKELLNG